MLQSFSKSFICLILVLPTYVSAQSIDPIELESTIVRAQHNIISKSRSQAETKYYWNMSGYLGQHYISQYYLFLKLFKRQSKKMKLSDFVQQLNSSQLPDGSWFILRDEAKTIEVPWAKLKHLTFQKVAQLTKAQRKQMGIIDFDKSHLVQFKGQLDATIFNYWALKVMHASEPLAIRSKISQKILRRSRNFIIQQGGLERAQSFSKVSLAIFGNYAWDEVPEIPLWVFGSGFFYDTIIKSFAQWVIPHIKPIAYLKSREISFDLGPAFDLSDLIASPEKRRAARQSKSKKYEADNQLNDLVQEYLLAEQHNAGSWGGYTSASLLTMTALLDFAKYEKKYQKQIQLMEKRAFLFLDEHLLDDSRIGKYEGIAADGRYWDTALMTKALLDSGFPKDQLMSTGEYLASVQQKNGGFPYGLDFETYPDTDDTALIMLVLDKLGGFQKEITKGVDFLLNLQNFDGGWAAFDSGNHGSILTDMMDNDFIDSADLFDESSPDITGHVLQALAIKNVEAPKNKIYKGLRYLKLKQSRGTQSELSVEGLWDSRWAVNYLNGTEAAVAAFRSFESSFDEDLFSDTKRHLLNSVNEDGAYGESTLSFLDSKQAMKGKSSATQTAWALSTLVDLELAKSREAISSVQYLIRQMKVDGRWSDHSIVGVGHPVVVDMVYPVYPYAYPLIALAKYVANACLSDELSIFKLDNLSQQAALSRLCSATVID